MGKYRLHCPYSGGGDKVFARSGFTPAEGVATVLAMTVPPATRWRLKRANLIAECSNFAITAALLGGEMRIALESNASGSYQAIAESALQTGRSPVYQGQLPIAHTLTAGQTVRARTTVRAGAGTNYFYGATIVLEELCDG